MLFHPGHINVQIPQGREIDGIGNHVLSMGCGIGTSSFMFGAFGEQLSKTISDGSGIDVTTGGCRGNGLFLLAPHILESCHSYLTPVQFFQSFVHLLQQGVGQENIGFVSWNTKTHAVTNRLGLLVFGCRYGGCGCCCCCGWCW